MDHKIAICEAQVTEIPDFNVLVKIETFFPKYFRNLWPGYVC